ncbi:MAG: PQQ-binding-like beta-propeller repeat protein [Dehalococcoidales bacterium]|nr:PQQ-binding-like beta-propeller repeat protein [Dehalococcoidales bacterium]
MNGDNPIAKNISNQDPEPARDSTETAGNWVICPVCHQPNPAGTWLCEHCWGAVLRDTPAFSFQKAREVSKGRLARLKRKKLIKLIALILTPPIILAVGVFLGFYSLTDKISKPPQSVNSSSVTGQWAMFQHDLGRSGNANSNGILPRGEIKWVFPTGGAVHSSPAVANGTVYIGSRDNKLYALDANTGAKRWEFTTDSWVDSSPVVADGVVYFGSNDSKLYALDAGTGKKLWDFKTQYAITSAAAVANGVVYFGGDDYYLYALDSKDGTKIWDYRTRGIVKSSPVVANGILYAGTGSDFSYALDTRDGRFRLRFLSHYPVYSSPVVNGSTVYFIHSDGSLFAVDGYARSWPHEHALKPHWTQLWLMGIPGIPQPPPQSGFLWGIKIGGTGSSSPAIANGTLYAGSDNRLVAVDLEKHQRIWEFEADSTIRSSPAVTDTAVFVGSEGGIFYAIDAASGEKLWDIPFANQIVSSPAVVNGTIYIASYDGNVYAIE